jgi:uncharacterized surface protein with fasciclin (FAS1) repeats
MQATEAVAEPTTEPTEAPTNTPEPTAIPPTPTVVPPTEPSVFISSGIKLEDLADKRLLGDMFEPNEAPYTEFTDKNISQFGRDLYASAIFILLNEGEAFTVFAPEYVFEDIPQGTISSGREFSDALLSHIVPGLYLQTDLLAMDGQSIETLKEGKNIDISVKDGVVYLNDNTMVIQEDILAQNGVIHIIDQFLLPPGE